MNIRMANRRKRKVVLFCARMVVWQPWPRISRHNNEPLSRWFHRKKPDSSFESTKLGEFWNELWWGISNKFRVQKIKR